MNCRASSKVRKLLLGRPKIQRERNILNEYTAVACTLSLNENTKLIPSTERFHAGIGGNVIVYLKVEKLD